MVLGNWYADIGSPRQINGVTDRWTSRQTDGFLALYMQIALESQDFYTTLTQNKISNQDMLKSFKIV